MQPIDGVDLQDLVRKAEAVVRQQRTNCAVKQIRQLIRQAHAPQLKIPLLESVLIRARKRVEKEPFDTHWIEKDISRWEYQLVSFREEAEVAAADLDQLRVGDWSPLSESESDIPE